MKRLAGHAAIGAAECLQQVSSLGTRLRRPCDYRVSARQRLGDWLMPLIGPRLVHGQPGRFSAVQRIRGDRGSDHKLTPSLLPSGLLDQGFG